LYKWKYERSDFFSLQEYFYGLANDLSPHSNVANFSDLSVYRIGGGPQAPRSALPIGAEPTADPTRVVAVNISQDLLHLVLAVSFAKEPEEIISRYHLKALKISLFSMYPYSFFPFSELMPKRACHIC